MNQLELLEQFVYGNISDIELHPNICSECFAIMENHSGRWVCECGIVGELAEMNVDMNQIESSNIRIVKKGNIGKYYSVTGDYSKIQLKQTKAYLRKLNKMYVGYCLPNAICDNTAEAYNLLQKEVVNYVDGVERRFVHRGSVKAELLASILYQECHKANIPRKKKDIATMLLLGKSGFSRGDEILQKLSVVGYYKLSECDLAKQYILRYAEGLNIVNQAHIEFAINLVKLSETLKVGMSSQISSKCAGAMCFICCNEPAGQTNQIVQQSIEIKCDSCKRSTYIKFCNDIIKYRIYFIELFNNVNFEMKMTTR